MANEAGKNVRIQHRGSPTSLSSNETTNELTSTKFRISDASKRALATGSDIALSSSNDGVIDPADYTVRHLYGTFEFSSSRTGETIDVTSGSYYPLYTIASGSSATMTLENQMDEENLFQDESPFRLYGLRDASFDFSRVEVTGPALDEAEAGTTNEPSIRDFYFTDGKQGIVEMDVTNANDDSGSFRAWYRLESDSEEASPDALVSSDLSFAAANPGQLTLKSGSKTAQQEARVFDCDLND